MNRILTADVIITLTREQARVLCVLHEGEGVEMDDIDTMYAALTVFAQQCSKQGVVP